MQGLADACVDLIYIDPPFFSGKQRRGSDPSVGYADVWDGDISNYLDVLRPRLVEMRRLLVATGSIYVHLDQRAVHYVKVLMDELFGIRCFLNDIAWLYGLGGSSPRYWPRKHDHILWYSREPDGQWFAPVMEPARSQRMRGQLKKTPDYWAIPSLNNMAAERTGYPTQKPEALLERIIASSCPEGGVVADFYCGSGVTPVVAERLGRRWLACDSSPAAVAATLRRLSSANASPERSALS